MCCVLRSCCLTSLRLRSWITLKYVGLCFALVVVLDFFGAFTHVFETTYDENFAYPLEGNIYEFVNALRHNDKPAVAPINIYNYTYVYNNKNKCSSGSSSYRVIYIVKSAAEHFDRRVAIRSTWGFENRFFDVPSQTVFVLGTHPNDYEIQAKIKLEAMKYKDIIQADFIDSYYNNTIKTMLGFDWVVKYCSNAKFYMFVDDDMYVSVKNVLRFLRSPTNYPDYLREPKKIDIRKREIRKSDRLSTVEILNKSDITSINSISIQISKEVQTNRTKRQVFDFELPEDVRLFTGYVFVSAPHRHKSSKWYVSLKEYPYHLWPPYVTAGAYILSKEALLDMYYTSFYTKHFRFDDIFLGLVAKKAHIEPFHCPEFHFYKKDYTKFNYKYVITSHGYDDPNELSQVWNEQKALGNA